MVYLIVDHFVFPAIELLLSRARGIERAVLQEFGENIISGKLEVERLAR
jgi:hypothetical protein